MADEATDQESTNEAAEQAALEAGFNSTDEEPECEPAQVEPEKKEEEPDPPAEPDKEEPAATPEPEITIKDLRALLDDNTDKTKQQISKLAGKLGELQQKIDAAKSTVSGISPKAREKMEKDFPELASMLFDNDGAPEPETVKEPTHEEPAPKEISLEELQEAQELLAFDHPDWDKVCNSEEFKAWMKTLPPAVYRRLNETNDPGFVSDKLTRFKKFQEDQATAKAAAEAVKATEEKKKQSRLESAITPQGVPRTATSSNEEDEEEAAMNAAFSGKK